jgi:hypothetical protein
MKTRYKLKLLAAAVFISASALADVAPAPAPQQAPPAQRGPAQQDMLLNPAERAEILQRLIAGLNGYYVYPEQAKAMETELRARDQRGDYAQITSAESFAATLTEDLQRVTKDRHLEVAYSERPMPPQEAFDAEEASPEGLEQERRLNYGVERVQRMDFNQGYLDLRAFAPPDRSGPKLAAAMSLLSDTDALVIDLRNNSGGDPATVALLASYLFDEKTRLNDIYDRPKNETTQYWTSDAHAGPTYGGGKKLYLLVSHDTFSAGEDFAYALKNLKRATLVGAATGGGAHPGTARRLGDHFAAMVPTGRSISPVTHTDWEGVGVQPDVTIDPEHALEKAQALYLTELLTTEKDAGRRERIAQRLAELH